MRQFCGIFKWVCTLVLGAMTADRAQGNTADSMVQIVVVLILLLFGITLSLQLNVFGITGSLIEILEPLFVNIILPFMLAVGGLTVLMMAI
jgi:hypothetical protein